MSRRSRPGLVLASGSPRRRELLALLDWPFEMRPGGLDEVAVAGHRPPAEAVVRVAEAKVRACEPMFPDGRIRLGADTVVVHDGQSLGQPADPDEAVAMLERQSGSTVEVLTGLAVLRPNGGMRTEVVGSELDLRPLARDEIDAYVATGAAAGKAGALEVQGAAAPFVTEVRGCWPNVAGLPVCTVGRMLGVSGDELPCPGPSAQPCRLRP